MKRLLILSLLILNVIGCKDSATVKSQSIHVPGNPDAFPHEMVISSGMTLRDYFAGQALMGLESTNVYPNGLSSADAAKAAYTIADAMLREREKH